MLKIKPTTAMMTLCDIAVAAVAAAAAADSAKKIMTYVKTKMTMILFLV